ncbi:hypothetical protein BJ138DRAFT_456514 [Hygrophoropsis aurantiaca]|uniref:Uncharacterized protein n=1 Tax=Hygrophoropsis aurantiaca TaxID=72124 RepID=A0ACB8A2L7_9AGAM|nr:hypothetical protein BJ138DRAFT_456514 [Hygrophoropsis aurantiaca]
MLHVFELLFVALIVAPTAILATPCTHKTPFRKSADTWALQVYRNEVCTGAHDYFSHSLSNKKGAHACSDLGAISAAHVGSFAYNIRGSKRSVMFWSKYGCNGTQTGEFPIASEANPSLPTYNLSWALKNSRSFHVESVDY